MGWAGVATSNFLETSLSYKLLTYHDWVRPVMRLLLFTIFLASYQTGYSAVGSASGLGPECQVFESPYPDKDIGESPNGMAPDFGSGTIRVRISVPQPRKRNDGQRDW